ncbi:hypothetical protein NQZ68_005279 [Dissostichus eleginoides]|nr:hypothetical protein NQZ68_005279 [Dissostichus eleginoides]
MSSESEKSVTAEDEINVGLESNSKMCTASAPDSSHQILHLSRRAEQWGGGHDPISLRLDVTLHGSSVGSV